MPDPQREFAVDVVRQLRQAGFTALWAGGCVRDLLLGRTPDDYDVATNALPDDVRQVFGKRRTLAIGESFGVILVKGPKGAGDVEVATFRREGPYLDGRHPESVQFCTAEEDARRRDFTINGMFYDPLDEQVHDYVGGRDDLSRRVVRAIGDPRARFTEDKLRMLRAVRIAARFDFTLDEPTALAIRGMADEILVVSQERIAQELKKMLVHPRRARAVQLAADVQLLPIILPELKTLATCSDRGPWAQLLKRLESLSEPPFEVPMAILLGDSLGKLPLQNERIEDCCRRLRLSNQELESIRWLASHRTALRDAARQPLSRFKKLLAQPLIRELLALARADALASDRPLDDVLYTEDYLGRTSPEEISPPPLITGDDLKGLGLQPGPEFKSLLDAVRDAQLDGRVTTRQEAIEFVGRLIP